MTCTTDHTRISTRYCPDCGESTNYRDITGLRSHIASHLRLCEQRAVEVNRRSSGPVPEYWKDRPEVYARRIKHRIMRSVNTVAKWQGWLTALDELIKATK